MPADGAAERTEQRRDIQGLRGIAVLLVVAYHARLPHVSSGFIGVDVFFVISGFVITAMLCRELEGSGRISLPRFYARRAKRLLPALAVVLVVVTFLGSLLFDSFATWQIADRTSIWASLFSSNYYLYSLPDGYFAVDTSLNPLLHTWTLGVEEQFYVLFPLLLIAGWHVARRYGAFALIGAGALASLALARHETYQPSARAEHFAFFSAPTRAWEFAAGALLAVGAPLVARVPRPVAFAGVVAGGAILLWAATGPSGDFERAAVYACAASVLLIAAGTATRRAGAPFGLRPLVWVGDRSYSWYLWHWPFIVYAAALTSTRLAAPAAAVASLVPAALSYRFVENRFRFDRRLVGRRVLPLVAVCVGVPLALAVTAPRLLETKGFPIHYWRYQQPPCTQTMLIGSVHSCLRATHGANRGTLALIGDSNADMYGAALLAAAGRERLNLRMIAFPGCPFVLARLKPFGTTPARCWPFAPAALRALLRMHPQLVVIGARPEHYVDDPHEWFWTHGRRTVERVAKRRLWEEGLRRELLALDRAGIRVLLLQPAPQATVSVESCSILRLRLGRCGGSFSRAAAESALAPLRRVQLAATAGLTHVHVLDLVPALCGARTCPFRVDGQYLYRDIGHLSLQGAHYVTPAIERAVHGVLIHDTT